jgi:hypothetical protein
MRSRSSAETRRPLAVTALPKDSESSRIVAARLRGPRLGGPRLRGQQ